MGDERVETIFDEGREHSTARSKYTRAKIIRVKREIENLRQKSEGE